MGLPIGRPIDNHVVTSTRGVIAPGRKIRVNGIRTGTHRIRAFVPDTGGIVNVLSRKARVSAGKIPIHGVLVPRGARGYRVGHG